MFLPPARRWANQPCIGRMRWPSAIKIGVWGPKAPRGKYIYYNV